MFNFRKNIDDESPDVVIICECDNTLDIPKDCLDLLKEICCGKCLTKGNFKLKKENKK